jgi:error-prone DNA polymerase
LKAHPVSFVRDQLADLRVTPNHELADERAYPHGTRVTVAGLVLVRQRPGTASGVVFITIEDETGTANLIVRPKIYETFRKQLRHAVLLIAAGTIERQGQVVHIMVRQARDGEVALARPAGSAEKIADGSRNFR